MIDSLDPSTPVSVEQMLVIMINKINEIIDYLNNQ